MPLILGERSRIYTAWGTDPPIVWISVAASKIENGIQLIGVTAAIIDRGIDDVFVFQATQQQSLREWQRRAHELLADRIALNHLAAAVIAVRLRRPVGALQRRSGNRSSALSAFRIQGLIGINRFSHKVNVWGLHIRTTCRRRLPCCRRRRVPAADRQLSANWRGTATTQPPPLPRSLQPPTEV